MNNVLDFIYLLLVWLNCNQEIEIEMMVINIYG